LNIKYGKSYEHSSSFEVWSKRARVISRSLAEVASFISGFFLQAPDLLLREYKLNPNSLRRGHQLFATDHEYTLFLCALISLWCCIIRKDYSI
jgi:hypothetical protein